METLKNKKVLITIIVLILILIIVAFNLVKNGDYETFDVKRGDLIEITEVSGKVVPSQEINLSFETSGKVTVINGEIGDQVKAGDVLARIDSIEVTSEIGEASANLNSVEAQLFEIYGDENTQGKLDSVKESLISVLKKAYVTSDDVIRNTVDTFITDPETRSPEFSVSLSGYYLRKDIEEQRVQIEDMLKEWLSEVNTMNASTITLIDAKNNIDNTKKIETILATISTGASEFGADGKKTQAQVDAYIASISKARTSISGILVEINNATEAVRSVEAEIPLITASIQGAKSTVNKLSSKKDNFTIIAPFDGVITDQNIELGEFIKSGEIVMSVVSEDSLEIESFVPEVNIAGIDIGDTAYLKLDAFGDDREFEALVSQVDPRETIKDGITTYRIVLDFLELDNEILSGMSTEIKIEKNKISDEIVIPRYLIQKDNSESFVELLKGKKKIMVSIELGKSDNAGNIIVSAGLSEGDKIVIPE